MSARNWIAIDQWRLGLIAAGVCIALPSAMAQTTFKSQFSCDAMQAGRCVEYGAGNSKHGAGAMCKAGQGEKAEFEATCAWSGWRLLGFGADQGGGRCRAGPSLP